ncbi:MAG TPA: DUF4105 domain-containing protein [Tepidisphaeraceae bacterium]|nr:DUF4105 domain-containing protein [Tepidisphaeraceae bacterium]
MRLTLVARCLAVFFLPIVVFASPARAEPVVSLITFGPGGLTFEKFGHTALRIRDDSTGLDIAYNWGLFDYENELELLTRFVNGRLEYWMEGFDGRGTVNAYAAGDRTVWEQELNLTPAQTLELMRFLMWNERPENRVYRYDYYRDNCTTRVRDAIDNALGDQMAAQLKGVPTDSTYRSHTRRITARDIPLYTALQTVLSDWIDKPLDAWEETFLPFELQRHVRSVMVTDAAGNRVPLVRSEVQIATGSRPMPAATVPTYWPGYLIVGVVVGTLMALLSKPARRYRTAGAMLFLLVLLWCGIGGMAGFIMAYAWAFTDHIASYGNENLLQTNPLLLALIPLTLFVLFGRFRKAASRLAVFIAALGVIGLVMQVLPVFDQVNADVIALALPINLGLAVALYRLLPQWQPNAVQKNDPASLTVAAPAAARV